jgi:hypothetical protein
MLEILVIPVSFPHVKGTLPPTIGTTLVHAIPTLRIAKKTTLTHKTFSTDKRRRAGFLSFGIIIHEKLSLHKHSQTPCEAIR